MSSDQHDSLTKQFVRVYGEAIDEVRSRMWVFLFVTTIVFLQISIASEVFPETSPLLTQPILLGRTVYETFPLLLGAYLFMPFVVASVREVFRQRWNNA